MFNHLCNDNSLFDRELPHMETITPILHLLLISHRQHKCTDKTFRNVHSLLQTYLHVLPDDRCNLHKQNRDIHPMYNIIITPNNITLRVTVNNIIHVRCNSIYDVCYW